MRNAYVNDFNNTVKSYYDELKGVSLITKERERELLIKAQEQNNVHARNELMTAHLKFVVEVAKQYTGYGVAMEDLIAEGNLGLIKAIEKYDLSKNVRFLSYAAYWIKFYIRDSVKKRYVVSKFEDKEILTTQTHNFDINTVEDVLDTEPIHEEMYTTEDEIHKLIDSNHLLNEILNTLSPRAKDIINMYYGLNGYESMTLDDISERLHISRERVRQIKLQALRRLRTHILSNSELIESFRN